MGMTTMDDRADATGQPLATVTICTRNRAASLARTLASITEAAGAVSEDWELLVVDNGSTDNTAEVVDGFAGSLPIRRIHHPVPGLSNARNAGMAAARGRFIIWTDDDLTVDREWLAAYLAAFRAWPDCAIFGGRAIPRYTEPVPAWFIACEEDLASLLAIRDAPGWEEITPERVPYGLNYAPAHGRAARPPLRPGTRRRAGTASRRRGNLDDPRGLGGRRPRTLGLGRDGASPDPARTPDGGLYLPVLPRARVPISRPAGGGCDAAPRVAGRRDRRPPRAQGHHGGLAAAAR